MLETLKSTQRFTMDLAVAYASSQPIGMTYTGLARAASEALMERFQRRELLNYDEFYLRTTPRFETGDPRYAWLNGVVAVANGQRTERGGLYCVFAID